VAVRIRMKKMGRLHRPFYRICVMDSRKPRDGRVLEQLGTYDPMIPETDARTTLDLERVKYWLSVGALQTEKVGTLLKKYGPEGTHIEKQKEAVDRLAQIRRRPTPPPRPVHAAETEAPAAADDQPAAE